MKIVANKKAPLADVGDIIENNYGSQMFIVKNKDGKYTFQSLTGLHCSYVTYDTIEELRDNIGDVTLYSSKVYDLQLVLK